MNDDQIKDIPSLRKTKKDAENLSAVKKAWPFLRPFFKVLGAEVDQIDETLEKVDTLIDESNELLSIPDKFNDLFAERGWILYSRMNMKIAKQCIELATEGNIEEAEKVLVDYYSSEEIEHQLNTMVAVKAFRERMPLAKKALIDFKEGRYYSTILVIMSLLDGMVNEIQHRGFFSRDVDLTAWDSIAAHSKGLQKLVTVLSQPRKKTRSEPISIPYRHGILHGMDLGYDNLIVAVKSWVALFATRDWALLAERNQLEAPDPESKKTLKEILSEWQEIQQDREELKNWKPRNLKIGVDTPLTGNPTDFPENTPERKLAEFLDYWKSNNCGYMAKCISTQIGHDLKSLPKQIREEYSGKKLESWTYYEINDVAPAVTVITFRVIYNEIEIMKTQNFQARLIYEDDKNFGVVRNKPGSKWSIVTYYLRKID